MTARPTRTADIAVALRRALISTAQPGPAAPRATRACARPRGEITAYIDDDAYPDPDWLRYIAWAYMTGGPRRAPAGPTCRRPATGGSADLVALAPGGPNHVLITDTVAEHVPGCNSTYRTEALRAIGGYDTRFRTAGDDVDVGWRIQENGGTIGFSAGAMVWHHRRGTAKGYLKQQRGYGYAEALLERKWPSRFNRLGHVTWPGQLYGPGVTPGAAVRGQHLRRQLGQRAVPVDLRAQLPLGRGAAHARVVDGDRRRWSWLGLIGLTWSPLLWAWPVALLMAGASVVVSLAVAIDGLRYQRLPTGEFAAPRPHARRAGPGTVALSDPGPAGRRADAVPPAWGRWLHAAPRQVRLEEWSEEWHSMEARLRVVEERLIASGAAVRRGRRLRDLGPGGPHRLVRQRPPHRHHRGARPRPPDGALEGVAQIVPSCTYQYCGTSHCGHHDSWSQSVLAGLVIVAIVAYNIARLVLDGAVAAAAMQWAIKR